MELLSNWENLFPPPSQPSSWSAVGSVYLSVNTDMFNCVRSTKILPSPEGFRTDTTWADYSVGSSNSQITSFVQSYQVLVLQAPEVL